MTTPKDFLKGIGISIDEIEEQTGYPISAWLTDYANCVHEELKEKCSQLEGADLGAPLRSWDQTETKQAYVIVKEYVNDKGVTLPIILTNNVSEIMEFHDEDEAMAVAETFEANSDSGWKYKVRKI